MESTAEFNEMINDPEKLAGQLGGTKDYIMDVCASMLTISICKVSLGNYSNQLSNIANIMSYLNDFDDADRYFYEKDRKETFEHFKDTTLPLAIDTIRTEGKCLNAALWIPVIKTFLEKSQKYIELNK